MFKLNFFTEKFRKKFFTNYANLIQIPSPSGFTENKTKYIFNLLNTLYPTVQTESGRVFSYIKGNSNQNTFLCAHFDVLGLTCEYIKENGCISFQPEGDFLYESIENSLCTIHTEKEEISGIIRSNESSLHIFKYTARDLERKPENMEIKLNCLYNNKPIDDKNKVEKIGIKSGDGISLNPNYYHDPETGFIISRGHDNQAGTQILISLAQELHKQKLTPHDNIVLCFNNCEERGYPFFFPNFANFPIKQITTSDIAIAVDAILNTPDLKLDETMTFVCPKDKLHRYNKKVSKHLLSIAINKNIHHSSGYMRNFGTEVSLSFLYGQDIITGMLGPVVDAIHSIERTHEHSLLNTISILWHLVTDMPYKIK